MNNRIKEFRTPKGETRFELRVSVGSGENRREIKRHFKTKSEARSFANFEAGNELAKIRSASALLGLSSLSATFGDEHSYWLQTHIAQLAPGTQKNYHAYWEEFRDQLGHLQIEEVTRRLMTEIESDLRKKGNSAQTVRNKTNWMKSVLNYAVTVGRIERNPIENFRSARVIRKPMAFWEAREAISFLTFASKKYPSSSDEYWKFLVYLTALNTSLRAGEVWGLKPRTLRASLGCIESSEQFDRVSKTFRETKGKRTKQVPLSEPLSEAIMCWVKAKNIGVNDVIFSNEGRPINHDNFYNNVFLKDVEEWGGRRICFHGMRHTAATLMTVSGVTLDTLQHIMGHQDSTTTQRYMHAVGGGAKTAAQLFSLVPKAIEALPKDDAQSKLS